MKLHVNEPAPIRYELAEALLLYRNERDTFVTRHDVTSNKHEQRLGPGTPVTGNFVRRLLTTLDRSPLTYVPPNVVAFSQTAIAWYEPAVAQPMFFSQTDDRSVLAFSGKIIPQPALLFIASSRHLRVYALAEDVRPTAATKLAKAPYWNVFDDHRVCTGTMVIPKNVGPRSTDAWTKAFFGSNFTHLSGRKRWRRPGTYSELLSAAVAARRFDPDWLDTLDLTVEEAVCGK